MSEIKQRGEISVATEHIFPVIKKWLYSEKEIFLREIVSNACDAITKLKRLEALAKYDSNGEEYKVSVKFDKENKTLTVSDNGIGYATSAFREQLSSFKNTRMKNPTAELSVISDLAFTHRSW